MASDVEAKTSPPKDPRRRRDPLILMLVLAALAIVALSVGVASCTDDDGPGGAVADRSFDTTTPSSGATGAGGSPAAEPPTGPTAAAGSGATLEADSTSLLADGAAGIEEQVGETATGTGLEVLSVTDGGFFVGGGEEDRQYVEFGGDVGDDETDQQPPAVGDVVDLEGEVRPAPEDPAATLDLDAEEARLVTERGAYVNATSVRPGG